MFSYAADTLNELVASAVDWTLRTELIFRAGEAVGNIRIMAHLGRLIEPVWIVAKISNSFSARVTVEVGLTISYILDKVTRISACANITDCAVVTSLGAGGSDQEAHSEQKAHCDWINNIC